jgi:hypothetical protein
MAGKRNHHSLSVRFQQQDLEGLEGLASREYLSPEVCHCEREISGYYGDAEHYRPKGAVKYKTEAGELEDATCEVLNPRQGRIVTQRHPGYFWLAYDWRNLLPSCVFCNSGQGKNERFDAEHYIVMVNLRGGLPA